MSTAAAANEDIATEREPAPRHRGDAWLLPLLALAVGSAWWLGQTGWYRPGDDVSYWIAVVGGSLMLALLLYPLRKYWRVMRHAGRVKWWFIGHMVAGIAGPWLILVHTTFQVGSLNAGVAFYSMLIVVASGVVGRFLYVRVHRGLDGELTSLRALQQRAGLVEASARSRLAFAPEVEARLRAFEQHERLAAAALPTQLRLALWLPVQQGLEQLRCQRQLEQPLRALAQQRGWTAQELATHRRRARRLVRHYLEAVVRVAQYTAFERVFALWHIAHLPFVVLLVVSAIVHVVAVHAY